MHQMDLKKTGERIRELMKEHEFTAERLAKELLVSLSTLRSYLYGHRKPPLEVLRKMCDLFGLAAMDDLVVWEGNHRE